MRIAVCTMIYNEPEFLPIWIRYYARQVGKENCFVIDHGSELFEKSILDSKNLIHLPRSPQDEIQRVRALSDFSAYLLNYYDVVVYTDVDEILVPNPRVYSDLRHFCTQNVDDVITAVGLNLQHIIDAEDPLDINQLIMCQRRWVRFVSAMCKPLVIRNRVEWSRGFHGCNRSVQFGELYLLHLRNFDLSISLRRLSRTRAIPRKTEADKLGAAHQLIEDAQAESWMRSAAAMPKRELESLSLGEDPVRSALLSTRTPDATKLRIDVSASELWGLPIEFRNLF